MSRLLTPVAERLISADDWFVANHKLKGRMVVPLAAWISWVQQLILASSGKVGWEFTDLLVRQPLFIEDRGWQSVRCDFQDPESDGGHFQVKKSPGTSEESRDAEILLEGSWRQPRSSSERLATPKTQTRLTREEFYRVAGRGGWSYGPALQQIEYIEFGTEGWHAEIGHQTVVSDSDQNELIALDTLLQGGAVLRANEESTSWVPYRIDLARRAEQPATWSQGIIFGHWLSTTSQERVAHVDWIDPVSGIAVLELRGVHFRQMAESSPQSISKPVATVAVEAQNLLVELRQAEIAIRPAILTHFIEGQVLDLLKWDELRRKDLARGFVAIGLDSLLAVDLQFRLQKALKFSLPPGTGLNQPTIADLATYLIEQHPELRT